MYYYAVSKLNIKSITHKFLIRGHTQNEGDTAHSLIEKCIKKERKSSPIYVPDQYVNVIRKAKKSGNPFTVNEMNYDNFFDLKALAEDLNVNLSKNVHGDQIKLTELKELLQPYYHILQVRGKLLRKKIPMAFNHWLKVPEEKLHEVIEIVNMVHNGTLLIDDIQDNSRFRRTIPAAHCVYGIPLSINTSLHVISLALVKLYEIGHPLAPKVYSEEVIEIVRGQGIDIYWRDNHICPTEAEYKQMAEKKTGRMFNMSVRMIQLFSDNKTDYTKLLLLFGLYFQIRDDYCNLNQQEALEDWPCDSENIASLKEQQFCEDITEGKFSLPIIHALKFPGGAPIMNMLKQRTDDICIKKYCISLLNKLGSMEYTRKTLMAIHKEIETEIARFGGNPEMDEVLAELLTWQ